MPLKQWEDLYSEMEQRLNTLVVKEEGLVNRTIQCVYICEEYLKKLRYIAKNHSFKSQAEEIHFFKYIKPKFAAKLFYNVYLFNLEYRRPRNLYKIERKYLLKQLKKIHEFFEDNNEFYKYYKTGATYLDDKFFMRGVKDVQLLLDTRIFYFDEEFTTSHGHTVASILAYEMLTRYIDKELRKLDKQSQATDSQVRSNLNWTENKVALIELIYALHSTGAINNGKVEIGELALAFETVFNVELNNYYRTYMEIRMRKSNKTKFMDLLKHKFIKRMEEDDQR